MQRRTLTLTLLVASAAAVLSLSALTAGARSLATPNPCKMLTPATVTQALGAKASAKLSSVPSGHGRLTVCTYTSGKNLLKVELGPTSAAVAAPGGAAVITLKNQTLGPRGTVSYRSFGGHYFVQASFLKGTTFGIVWSNKVPLTKMIDLAQSVYDGLK